MSTEIGQAPQTLPSETPICTYCHEPAVGGCFMAPDGEHSTSLSFSPSQSPTPVKVRSTMSNPNLPFGQIIERLLGGHAVRRLSWPEGECVFFKPTQINVSDGSTIPGDILFHRGSSGLEQPWAIARQDLENADDWVVIE